LQGEGKALVGRGPQPVQGSAWSALWVLTQFCIAAFAEETASTFCGQYSTSVLMCRGVSPIRMLLFEITPNFSLVMQTGGHHECFTSEAVRDRDHEGLF